MAKVLSGLYLLYVALIFILFMFITLPFVLISSTLFKGIRGKRLILWCLRGWAWAFSALSLFWINTVNQSKIDQKTPHIYVGNHGSYLDAVAVCISIPQSFSPLGKIEMARIPVFGWIYKRIVVMIDRGDKASRTDSVLALKNEINKGQSILIFPEGTMNKTTAHLSPFYDGAFKIAIETQTPIQPFVLLNNRRLLSRIDPLSARPGILTTVFLPAITVNGLCLSDLPALKLKVQQLMDQAIEGKSAIET